MTNLDHLRKLSKTDTVTLSEFFDAQLTQQKIRVGGHKKVAYSERTNTGHIQKLDIFVSGFGRIFNHTISNLVFEWSASLDRFMHKIKYFLCSKQSRLV
jgi:hypothetical protein